MRRPVVDPRFPQLLRELRQESGLSLRELASRVFVSRSTLHGLENGTRLPTFDTARRLDEVLGAGGELAALVTAADSRIHEADHGQHDSNDQVSHGATDADTDLVEFAGVLDQRSISSTALLTAELACERLDQSFARLGPDEVLSRLRVLLKAVLAQLHKPQSLGHQRRLVTLAGRLADLRAWACFDIDEHAEAER